MKVDVEGHEIQLFRGCRNMLEQRRIRDVVFEDAAGAESLSMKLFEQCGYSVFTLELGLLRLRAIPMAAYRPSRTHGVIPSFLATSDSPRARQRLKGWGWRVLYNRA